jgi:hypothetical protein
MGKIVVVNPFSGLILRKSQVAVKGKGMSGSKCEMCGRCWENRGVLVGMYVNQHPSCMCMLVAFLSRFQKTPPVVVVVVVYSCRPFRIG